MQFLADIAIGVLTVYLAFTNTLADKITDITILFSEPNDIAIEVQDRAPRSIEKLSSAYQSIPKILLENSAYQGASILGATSQTQNSTPTQALVNIYCTHKTTTYTRVTTGTGYFIDSDGIILTNAHVAQFLLLGGVEGSTECIVRTGNPAIPAYKAELLYISPAWVQKNARLINTERPQGTGERDYALLYVTAGLNNKPMPRSFPSISFSVELMPISTLKNTVYAAGYPAETLFSESDGNAQLIPRQATTSITELMTFTSNLADVFTIAGSEVGEQGSSGGPVVNLVGEAIGLISTRGDDAKFGKGSLRAITLSYIDRTIREETGFTLTQNLSGNLPFRAKLYKETMVPFLTQILQREMTKETP